MTDGSEQVLSGADDAFYDALLDDDPAELYDSAPCGYLSTLPDGTIVKANRTFLTWTGHDRRALAGRTRFSQLLSPGDRIFYETHYAPLLRMQGSVRELAMELVLADGTRLPVLLNAVAKVGPGGEPLMIRIAVFDARERRAYEEELLAARQRAEASEARARALAATLQQSFLPPTLPVIPNLDLGGAYRPAGDGSEVGGDFYDIFETGRGRVGVAVGDVCGKGADAAVVTVLARHTVRAQALRLDAPSEVLDVLHEAMLRYHPHRFCTVLFMTVAPGVAGARVTVSSGGHQLPLLVGADGEVRAVGASGRLLGFLPRTEREDTDLDLPSGHSLVLYTDGVPEARNETGFFGDEGLRRVLAETAGRSAQEVATAIVDAAVDFQQGDTRDDIAVVVIRSTDDAAG